MVLNRLVAQKYVAIFMILEMGECQVVRRMREGQDSQLGMRG
jgi:hypothetical protein